MIDRQEILARFSKVYQSGVDQYQCLCPVHDDRNASLGLKFKDDRMIMNCFAGCSAESILESIGLVWNDIMPDTLHEEWRPNANGTEMINIAKAKMRFNPFAIMKSMQEDYLFIALSAKELTKGNALVPEDVERLHRIARKHKEIYEYLK
jgi:hypothetical protein